MGRYKKYLTIMLIFSIHMMPFNLAYAASLGGWSMSNPVAQGASTLYNGAKNVLINGKNVAKTSTALITPTATQVAKVLARGAAGYALSVAVEQLLGAVDWVLDPENNQIVYYEKPETINLPKLWVWDASMEGKDGVASAREACTKLNFTKAQAQQFNNYMYQINGRVKSIDGDTAVCEFDAYNTYSDEYYGKSYSNINKKVNTAYNPESSSENERKTLPLPTVAQKVISNAQSGDVSAQEATTAAAADMVAEAEKDSTKARPIVNQLESNAETATDETATGEAVPKDPTAPDATKPTNISLEFPKFCGWAPSVCEAAQVVISFPTLVTEWWETSNSKAESWASSIAESWTAAKEWATSEPTKENTQLDFDENQQVEPDTKIIFATSCPDKIPLVFSWNGATLDFSFDFTIWCNAISAFVYPIVVSMGALHALYIVSGVRQNG